VLEVASDSTFRDVVLAERIPAREIVAERDYTVRVDLDGRLAPDRRYAYRFRYGKVASPTGVSGRCPRRTQSRPPSGSRSRAARTTRAAGSTRTTTPRRRRSTSSSTSATSLRELHARPRPPGRRIVLPSGARVAQDLADFRALHRTYRSDRALRAPWSVTR
jgi:alkaline phosphatase D